MQFYRAFLIQIKMTKDELIVKQQLKIEEYESKLSQNAETINDIKMLFYAIGQPLNDNVLKFNNKQLQWCFEVMDRVTCLNAL
jgi:hypothetical protein